MASILKLIYGKRFDICICNPQGKQGIKSLVSLRIEDLTIRKSLLISGEKDRRIRVEAYKKEKFSKEVLNCFSDRYIKRKCLVYFEEVDFLYFVADIFFIKNNEDYLNYLFFEFDVENSDIDIFGDIEYNSIIIIDTNIYNKNKFNRINYRFSLLDI